MQVLVDEQVVKNVKYQAFDGTIFKSQKECEKYEQFKNFMEKYTVDDYKSKMMIDLFNTFLKPTNRGVYTESETFVLKYDKKVDKEFFENIAFYIEKSFDETDTYMSDLGIRIALELENYSFDDDSLVLVHFVYDSDYEGNGHFLQIELIDKKKLLEKLGNYKRDIENAIVDAIATLN